MRGQTRYSVVTAVVTILAIIGMARMALRPLLPAPTVPISYDKRGDYLRQGQAQRIGWLPLDDTDFAIAGQSGKPVLLVVGAAWNRAARIADRYPFQDPDLQVLIPDSFVPVRVDCDENPEWLNGFFPLSRPARELDIGFQAYFLSPDGRMYSYAPSSDFSRNQDDLSATGALVAGRNLLATALTRTTRAAGQSVREIDQLRVPPRNGRPDYKLEDAYLQMAADTKDGGFPSYGQQFLKPEAFRFELLSGQGLALRSTLDPLLGSPIVDWLDGGFFRCGDQDWSDLQFDKVAVSNADMMSLVALYGQVMHSGFGKLIAQSAFDALATRFALPNGLLASCRIGDEDPSGRSASSSFAARDMRSFWNSGILSAADRDWARSRLNLDPIKNPQLCVSVSDVSVPFAQAERFNRVLQELRAAKSSVPVKYGTIAYADVNGYVSARLVECARLWRDPVRLSHALRLADSLRQFLNLSTIHHRVKAPFGASELTDYLGYADACLQCYLATGNERYFDEGLRELLQARGIFRVRAGVWIMASPSREGLPKTYLAPGLADNLYESTTAAVIRLESAYARLSAGVPDSDAISSELAADANAAVAAFAKDAASLGIHASGYYCSSLRDDDPAFAVAVGPDATELANELFRRVPTRLVSPAEGAVRKDLQRRDPGIYVIHGEDVEGPMGVEEAARKLPAQLRGR